MAMLKMVSPWMNYYQEVKALFERDPEIKIVFDEDNYEIKLYVEKPSKAEALIQLLPTERQYGNVTLKITVIPANTDGSEVMDLFWDAFDGNPALAYVEDSPGIGAPFNYVVFENKVVQYHNDDISDANGLRSTLYQEIAKDVFGDIQGVSFCTEKK